MLINITLSCCISGSMWGKKSLKKGFIHTSLKTFSCYTLVAYSKKKSSPQTCYENCNPPSTRAYWARIVLRILDECTWILRLWGCKCNGLLRQGELSEYALQLTDLLSVDLPGRNSGKAGFCKLRVVVHYSWWGTLCTRHITIYIVDKRSRKENPYFCHITHSVSPSTAKKLKVSSIKYRRNSASYYSVIMIMLIPAGRR